MGRPDALTEIDTGIKTGDLGVKTQICPKSGTCTGIRAWTGAKIGTKTETGPRS